MKLLLDQGLPRSAAMLLQECGYESFHVADMGLSAVAITVDANRIRLRNLPLLP